MEVIFLQIGPLNQTSPESDSNTGLPNLCEMPEVHPVEGGTAPCASGSSSASSSKDSKVTILFLFVFSSVT